MIPYPMIRQAAFALSLVVGASLASGCHVQFRSTTGSGGNAAPPPTQTAPSSRPKNRPPQRPAPITAAPAPQAPVVTTAPAPAPQAPVVTAPPAPAPPAPPAPAAPPVPPTQPAVSRRPMTIPAPTPTVAPTPMPTAAPRQVQAPAPDEPTPMPGRGRQVAPPTAEKVPPGLAKKQPAMPPGLAKKRGAAVDSAEGEPGPDNGRFTADPKKAKAKSLK